MATTVVVVGSAHVDYTVRVATLPAPGQTVIGPALRVGSGGKGANQALAAARLGADVYLVACLGDDAAAGIVRDALAAAGVHTGAIRTADGVATGGALIMVDAAGENSIAVGAGSNAVLDAAMVASAAALVPAPAVVLTQGEIAPAAVAAASELAVRTGARWVLNLAPVGPVDPEVLARADPLVVNQHEARELLGGDPASPAETARALIRLGPRSAVVTLGGDGAAWCSGDGSGLVPPVPVETVVDTTGAGDAFTAALAVGRGHGLALPDAVRAGAAAGAWAVGSDGANPALPPWNDLVAP